MSPIQVTPRKRRVLDSSLLSRGDVVALVAAIALLFLMAATWYGTTVADDARSVAAQDTPAAGATSDGASGLTGDPVQQARGLIQQDERNAWAEPGAPDRIILVLLIVTIALAVATAWGRAAGRRAPPPLTPSAVTAVAALLTAGLVGLRMAIQPGNDQITTIHWGAYLSLVALGVVALGSASALRAEQLAARGSQRAEAEPRATPGPEQELADPGPEAAAGSAAVRGRPAAEG